MITQWASFKFPTIQGDPAYRAQIGYRDVLCSPLKLSVFNYHVLYIVISITTMIWF